MRTYPRNSFRWTSASIIALAIAPAASLADAELLLSMPEPPVGYFVYADPIQLAGRPGGKLVVISKPDSSARIIITVETAYDRSTKPNRIAGAKGYINGMAGTLKEEGLKLEERKLPDLENADLTKPVRADMTFSRPDGTKLYVQQFVFFSNYGYSIQISAPDPQEVETLAKWAAHIKPAE